MATTKYKIPIVLNTETDIGLVNIYNSFVKGKVIYNILEHPNIEVDNVYKYVLHNKELTIYSLDMDIFWSYPVMYTSMYGNKYTFLNTNEMVMNVYNDIRRIIKIKLKNKNNIEYHCLYIDPAYGFNDSDQTTEYKYMPAAEVYAEAGCEQLIYVSPEGQLIKFVNSDDIIIHSFYQLDKYILVYTNKGIYFLVPIDEGNFFEIVEVPNVGSIDVRSAVNTYSTETVSFFVYENELWSITTNGAKKIGGYNIIKQLNPNMLLSNSIGAILINRQTKQSIIYTFDNGFSGIINQFAKGIKYSKFVIGDNYINSYPIIVVKNELNDNQLKVIKRIVVSGLIYPVYAKLKIMSDISNTQTYITYNFNNEGVCFPQHICKKLDFTVDIEKENTFSQVRNIEIYYEYVRAPEKYRYIKEYEPAW